MRSIFAFMIGMIPLLASSQVDEVNSIIDKLDERLQKQEQVILNPSERTSIEERKRRIAPPKVIHIKKKKISGSTKTPEDRLKDIAEKVLELETSVSDLDNRLQVDKQRTLEQSSIDNYVRIIGENPHPDKLSIRTMIAKIDGYNVYQLDERTGLWIPTHEIPLYSGPLTPGEHILEIDVGTIDRKSKPIAVNSNIYKRFTKSFKITIPNGSYNKTLKFPLVASEDQLSKPKAQTINKTQAKPETSEAEDADD